MSFILSQKDVPHTSFFDLTQNSLDNCMNSTCSYINFYYHVECTYVESVYSQDRWRHAYTEVIEEIWVKITLWRDGKLRKTSVAAGDNALA